MLKQQPFSFISLPQDETFASFYLNQADSALNSNNYLPVTAIKSLLNDNAIDFIYLWGVESSGKTHLLHAACAESSANEHSVALISLQEIIQYSPEMLDGLEQLDLVCIDDIELIAQQAIWEEALFDLFNRIREVGTCKLIITANAPPKQLNIKLPDLVSRLSWGQTYQLHPLNDEEKLVALQQRATLRGFELSDEIAQFLVKRVERDPRSLFTLLNKLDRAMILEKRTLTLPFVKQVLNL